MDFKDKLIYNIGVDRYNHSLRVKKVAMELAQIYDEDLEHTEIAAMLHDCGKYLNKKTLLKNSHYFGIMVDGCVDDPIELLHSHLGSKIAEIEYGIVNEEILNAIYYHTTGRKNMTLLEKIIYIADFIEPSRTYNGIEEIRQLAYEDLDKSILMALDITIVYLINKNKFIHLDTIKARNYLNMVNAKIDI